MRVVVPLVLLAACTASSDTEDVPRDGDSDADTDSDSDTDSDADTDADTDTDPGIDTDTDTNDTDTDPPPLFEISSPDMIAHSTAPCLQQLPLFATCEPGGQNLNPEIVWTGVPVGTLSIALLFDDIDFAPGGNPFDHWAVYNIDAAATGIPQQASGTDPTAAMPAGAMEVGGPESYNGSCSGGQNTYRWRLLALDATIPNGMADNIAEIEMYANMHTLGLATMCHCPDGNCTTY